MISSQRIALALLRIAMGWYFFWAGITKVLDPEWSAAGFLLHAAMFSDFYAWFAGASVLPIINMLNSWGLMLIGIALMVGASVRLSALFGSVLMLLYYFPQEAAHSFIVDDHIVFILVLGVLHKMDAGLCFGAKEVLMRLRFVRQSQMLQQFFS